VLQARVHYVHHGAPLGVQSIDARVAQHATVPHCTTVGTPRRRLRPAAMGDAAYT
jgi:hypothetical protein